MAPDADHPRGSDDPDDGPDPEDMSAPWGRPRRSGEPTPPPPALDETIDLGTVAPSATSGTGPAALPGGPDRRATAPLVSGPPTGRDEAPPGGPPAEPAPRRRTAALAVVGCIVVLVVVAVAVGVALASRSSGADDPPAAAPGLEGRTIVIDPGHNGANPENQAEISREIEAGGLRKACDVVGAEGGGQTESAFNLDVAERLRDELEDRGAEVVLTRTDDEGVGPCLDERARLATEEGADVLLSIHAHGDGPETSGFHVTSSPLSGEGSDVLATDVRDGLVAEDLVPSDDEGVDGIDVRRDLGTLNLSSVPAVIVDAGNLQSPVDEETLGTPSGRQRIADGMADGTEAFLAGR